MRRDGSKEHFPQILLVSKRRVSIRYATGFLIDDGGALGTAAIVMPLADSKISFVWIPDTANLTQADQESLMKGQSELTEESLKCNMLRRQLALNLPMSGTSDAYNLTDSPVVLHMLSYREHCKLRIPLDAIESFMQTGDATSKGNHQLDVETPDICISIESSPDNGDFLLFSDAFRMIRMNAMDTPETPPRGTHKLFHEQILPPNLSFSHVTKMFRRLAKSSPFLSSNATQDEDDSVRALVQKRVSEGVQEAPPSSDDRSAESLSHTMHRVRSTSSCLPSSMAHGRSREEAAGDVRTSPLDTGAGPRTADDCRRFSLGLPDTATADEFRASGVYNEKGQIIDPAALQNQIFIYGITPESRPHMWPFLMNIFSWQSTAQERLAMRRAMRAIYNQIQKRWLCCSYDENGQQTNTISDASDLSLNKLIEAMRRIEKDVLRADCPSTDIYKRCTLQPKAQEEALADGDSTCGLRSSNTTHSDTDHRPIMNLMDCDIVIPTDDPHSRSTMTHAARTSGLAESGYFLPTTHPVQTEEDHRQVLCLGPDSSGFSQISIVTAPNAHDSVFGCTAADSADASLVEFYDAHPSIAQDPTPPSPNAAQPPLSSPLTNSDTSCYSSTAQSTNSTTIPTFPSKVHELMFNVLMTYAVYDPSVNYVQGMTDLLTPLLVVGCFDSVTCFFMFAALMQRLRFNYVLDSATMKENLHMVRSVVRRIDPKLYRLLEHPDNIFILFCYRPILLLFKREYSSDDILDLWEAVWACTLTRNFHVFVAAAALVLNTELFNEARRQDQQDSQSTDSGCGTLETDHMLSAYNLMHHDLALVLSKAVEICKNYLRIDQSFKGTGAFLSNPGKNGCRPLFACRHLGAAPPSSASSLVSNRSDSSRFDATNNLHHDRVFSPLFCTGGDTDAPQSSDSRQSTQGLVYRHNEMYVVLLDENGNQLSIEYC